LCPPTIWGGGGGGGGGGGPPPPQPGVAGSLCKNGCVNLLTRDIPTSNLAMGNCGQSGIVEVELYKGTPPPMTAFTRPKGAAA
jgi:trimethylamine-N-oxide reductase (cytochrome c)